MSGTSAHVNIGQISAAESNRTPWLFWNLESLPASLLLFRLGTQWDMPGRTKTLRPGCDRPKKVRPLPVSTAADSLAPQSQPPEPQLSAAGKEQKKIPTILMQSRFSQSADGCLGWISEF